MDFTWLSLARLPANAQNFQFRQEPRWALAYVLGRFDTHLTWPELQGPGQFAQVIYGCGKYAKLRARRHPIP